MKTVSIELAVGQAHKIIAALRLLPAEPDNGEFYTERPEDLIMMLQNAIDEDDSDALHSFVS